MPAKTPPALRELLLMDQTMMLVCCQSFGFFLMALSTILISTNKRRSQRIVRGLSGLSQLPEIQLTQANKFYTEFITVGC